MDTPLNKQLDPNGYAFKQAATAVCTEVLMLFLDPSEPTLMAVKLRPLSVSHTSLIRIMNSYSVLYNLSN
jgi:hypothetical protein